MKELIKIQSLLTASPRFRFLRGAAVSKTSRSSFAGLGRWNSTNAWMQSNVLRLVLRTQARSAKWEVPPLPAKLDRPHFPRQYPRH